jgi:hypothetical protein
MRNFKPLLHFCNCDNTTNPANSNRQRQQSSISGWSTSFANPDSVVCEGEPGVVRFFYPAVVVYRDEILDLMFLGFLGFQL